MPRKHLDTRFNLILEIQHVKRYPYPLLEGEAQEKSRRDALDTVEALIKQHVVPHSPVDFVFRREAIRDYRCEFCDGAWTEESETYNGGCCARDVEEEYARPPRRLLSETAFHLEWVTTSDKHELK